MKNIVRNMKSKKSDFTNSSQMIFLVLREILRCLQIQVPNGRLYRLIEDQSYQNSLRTINDVLIDLNIETKTYQLEWNDLNLITCPLIAYSGGLYKKFLVVVAVLKNQIKYYDPTINNYVIVEKSLFVEGWTGVVLVPFIDETMEGHFHLNKRKRDKKKEINIIIGIGIITNCIIISIQIIFDCTQNFILWASFIVLKIIGIFIVSQIVMIEAGESSSIAVKICKTSGCRNVLHSKVSKLFSWLTLGDAGVIYFSSGILMLVIAPFVNNIVQVVYLLSLLNLSTLPITLSSIYYQRFILKSWCPFCLAVSGALWMEFLLGLRTCLTSVISLSIDLILLFCFGAISVSVGWLVVKKMFISRMAAKETTAYITQLKKDRSLFLSVLSNQESVIKFTSSKEIVLGNENAENELIAIISLNCHSCHDLYKSIKDFLISHSEELRIVLRFKSHGWDDQVIEHILTYNIENMKDMALILLEDWFNRENKDIKLWEKKFRLDNMAISDSAIQIRKEYHNWYSYANIQGVPAMILNNKLIPILYTFNDIRHFVVRGQL